MTEENVDDLVNDAMAPESPKDAPTEDQPYEQDVIPMTENDRVSQQAETSHVLKHDGKELSLDDHKYKMYAQKGLDYEQKMHQLRVDRKMWEKERSQSQSDLDELKQINDYSKQNPEFERIIREQWARVQGGGGKAPSQQYQEIQGQQTTDPAINAILERLDRQDQQLKVQQEVETEAKMESAIENYKAAHGYLDWETKDEFGQTLEDKITQHAIDSQIPNFRAAARDMLFDEHMTRAKLSSKEQTAKTIQKQNKLGLGKVTKEPQMQIQRQESDKGKSYNQIAAEVLRELGTG